MNEQFGFRRKHSTTQQLTRVCEHITKNFNLKRNTGIALLDIEKAFDTVYHKGLITKLHAYKFPQYLIKLISSYLADRKFRVRLDQNTYSSYHRTHEGVPQGSILGPILFLLYINDIPVPRGTSLALYADDTAIVTSSPRSSYIAQKLTKALHILETYFRKWKIRINPSKTELIIFTRRYSKQYVRKDNVTFQGKIIQWLDHVKYLGVTFDKRLTWRKHIENTVRKGHMALRTLYPLICPRNGLDNNLKATLYNTCVRPVLTYAAAVWGYAASTHLQKLQRVQNKFIRIAYKPERGTWFKTLAESHGICPIEDFIHKQTINFYQSLKHNNTANTLIQNLGQYSIDTMPFHYKHKLPKHRLL